MKVNGSIAPSSSFSVFNEGGIAIVSFYENVVQKVSDDGNNTSWEWDEYTIKTPYRDMLSSDIEANYSNWLLAAKECDEKSSPVDEYQLRADVDYLNIITGASSPYGIQTLALDDSEPESDKEVLDLAYKYYPARWGQDRLLALLAMGKLIQSDFDKIVGNDVAE